MQYILTQQELDNLVPVAKLHDYEHATELAKRQILKLANFTCIHDGKPFVTRMHAGYCDDCPCASKHGDDQQTHKSYSLLCKASKNFSK
jgi:hypothetical protein